jgi:membrane protein
MLVCPILFIMSSSITVVITSQVMLIVEKLAFLGPVGGLIIASLRILPYAVIWVMFTFIYIFLPNTKVNFRSGLMAGIIAGTIYQVVQWAYIAFQIGVSKYGAIYGSFAALPLFLIWLQISWLVVLLGAEISFAEQNVDTYEFEADSLKVSYSFKKLLALAITHLCVKKFHEGGEPPTAAQLSNDLEIPIRLVRQVLYELTEAGVLSEVKVNSSQVIGYHPSRDIGDLTIQNVLDRLDRRGTDTIPITEPKTMQTFRNALAQFHDTIQASPSNILLKDVKS